MKFIGHELRNNGLAPSRDRIQSVVDMTRPCPRLSDATKLLSDVLKKNLLFFWEKPQEEAFKRVKQLVTEASVLKLFNPKAEITLTVDASSTSLGAALLQDAAPVEYAAKALTPAQVNYSQIEKELQAIVFGCTRFYSYVYGRQVDIETDHKPLLGVFNKQLDTASPRLQRMLLQLQRYDFKFI